MAIYGALSEWDIVIKGDFPCPSFMEAISFVAGIEVWDGVMLTSRISDISWYFSATLS